MRFLADMGISPSVVVFLREGGHDAVHLVERALDTMQDPDILQLARDEKRILLTHDLDFSDLVAAGQAETPSVVVFRMRDMRPERVVGRLRLLLERHETVLKSGAIFSVTETLFRWRVLPFTS
jgi:predicted nuclease of predicted toxin-antitoxin system